MPQESQYRLPLPAIFAASLAAVAAGLLALALPAERVMINDSNFTTVLAMEHSGKIIAAFLVGMAALQAWFFFRLKTWAIWPGMVAGAYISLFATIRILRLWAQQNTLQEINTSHEAAVHPQAGLWLLLASGITLLVLQAMAFRQNK